MEVWDLAHRKCVRVTSSRTSHCINLRIARQQSYDSGKLAKNSGMFAPSREKHSNDMVFIY